MTDTKVQSKEGSTTLLNEELIRRRFLRVAFAGSHGASEKDLGVGLLYYTLSRLVRARVAVCVGSGGGFVPALMAQAQCDLAIDPCATYLVDAVLPELAFGSPLQSGGWLTHGNDIVDSYSQVRALRLLSVDAARLFASRGVRIDYLHIDGDHSRDGVRDDLRAYAPLMNPGGIVTLHDATLSTVEAAVSEFLASNPTFERLSFSELGAGTIVLRSPGSASQLKDAGDRICLIDDQSRSAAEAAGSERIRFERWRYLTSPAYMTRYALAKPWIDEENATVLEIGGYPNSVVHVLERSRNVVAIEPYAPASYEERIRSAARAKNIEFTLVCAPLDQAVASFDILKPYNLVALGFDLTGAREDGDSFAASAGAFYRATSAARRVAVEWPDAVQTGVLWNAVAEALSARLERRVSLDLSTDPVADEFLVKDKRAHRNLSLWEMTGVLASTEHERRIVSLAKAQFADRLIASDVERPILTVGSPVSFLSSENSCTKYLGFGWSRPEGAFTHALGGESDIVFELEPACAKEGLFDSGAELSLTLRPVVAPGGTDRRRIAIYLNDSELYAGALDKEEVLKFLVARDVLKLEGLNVLRILHRDRVKVSEIRPWSTDNRELSVSLVGMMLAVTSGA